MSANVPHLDVADLWSALNEFDPVRLFADRLVEQNPVGAGSLTALDAPGLLLLDEPVTGARCLFPAVVMRALRNAALGVLAAKTFLPRGEVRTCVLGRGLAAQLQIALLVKHVAEVRHVAVCAPRCTEQQPLLPHLRDELDRSRISFSCTDLLGRAVLGATLVIATEHTPWPLDANRLIPGTVVVNASGAAPPDAVAHEADQTYVDDLRLLPHGAPMRVESDLRGVLRAEHPGRTSRSDTVLIELLGTDALDAELARQLYWSTLLRGLDLRRPE